MINQDLLYKNHHVTEQPKYYDGKLLCPICKDYKNIDINGWEDYNTEQCANCDCHSCLISFTVYFKLEYSATTITEDLDDDYILPQPSETPSQTRAFSFYVDGGEA